MPPKDFSSFAQRPSGNLAKQAVHNFKQQHSTQSQSNNTHVYKLHPNEPKETKSNKQQSDIDDILADLDSISFEDLSSPALAPKPIARSEKNTTTFKNPKEILAQANAKLAKTRSELAQTDKSSSYALSPKDAALSSVNEPKQSNLSTKPLETSQNKPVRSFKDILADAQKFGMNMNDKKAQIKAKKTLALEAYNQTYYENYEGPKAIRTHITGSKKTLENAVDQEARDKIGEQLEQKLQKDFTDLSSVSGDQSDLGNLSHKLDKVLVNEIDNIKIEKDIDGIFDPDSPSKPSLTEFLTQRYKNDPKKLEEALKLTEESTYDRLANKLQGKELEEATETLGETSEALGKLGDTSNATVTPLDNDIDNALEKLIPELDEDLARHDRRDGNKINPLVNDDFNPIFNNSLKGLENLEALQKDKKLAEIVENLEPQQEDKAPAEIVNELNNSKPIQKDNNIDVQKENTSPSQNTEEKLASILSNNTDLLSSLKEGISGESTEVDHGQELNAPSVSGQGPGQNADSHQL